jgi:hypothetical protein
VQLGPLALILLLLLVQLDLYSLAPVSQARLASPLIPILLLVQLGPIALYFLAPASPPRPASPYSSTPAGPARLVRLPFIPLLLLVQLGLLAPLFLSSN